MTIRRSATLVRCLAAAVFSLALVAPGLSSASAQTTPLRMMDKRAQQCTISCSQRAQSCYRNARSGSAKENCENGESICKRRC